MSDRSLYFVDTIARHAVVALSADDANRITQSQDYVEIDERGLVSARVLVTLATEMPDLDHGDADLAREPDVIAEAKHPRRRWTIRRWVTAQALPPMPPTVAPAVDVLAYRRNSTGGLGACSWSGRLRGNRTV